jgi:hypothetical protein
LDDARRNNRGCPGLHPSQHRPQTPQPGTAAKPILPAARIAKAFGAAIGSVDGARKLAGTPAGTPWIRGFLAGGMNWELPDLDLARIWGSDSRRVGAMRRRHGAGPSRWIERDERNASDAAYREAVAREREAAMDRRRLLAMANRALDQAEQDKSKERRGRPAV